MVGHAPDFWWKEIDVRNLLPTDWDQKIRAVADRFQVARTLVARSITSRESSTEAQIPVLSVGGKVVRAELPWLHSLYTNEFKVLGKETLGAEIETARDERITVCLNVQRGSNMRYECHVDTNPLEGLLYVTDHPPGDGGELVISRNRNAVGVAEIGADAVRIYPRFGHLVFFDARHYPHYVENLRSENGVRIAVSMNYYTNYCTEMDRAPDLNRHLFGED
jgi:hypothetical protein